MIASTCGWASDAATHRVILIFDEDVIAVVVKCLNLDTGKSLYFVSRTPLEAMNALLYYLNLSKKDNSAKIQLLGGGRTLSLVHAGETWSCRNV